MFNFLVPVTNTTKTTSTPAGTGESSVTDLAKDRSNMKKVMTKTIPTLSTNLPQTTTFRTTDDDKIGFTTQGTYVLK